jgi:plasmid stabilization system protein ParE
VKIRAHIGQDSPLAAQRMALRLKQAGESLAVFPERGRKSSGGLREWPLIYPYIIRYKVRPGAVEIVRIKHGAQRPE